MFYDDRKSPKIGKNKIALDFLDFRGALLKTSDQVRNEKILNTRN